MLLILLVRPATPEKMLFDRVYVEFGTNMGAHVSSRIRAHLESVPQVRAVHELLTPLDGASIGDGRGGDDDDDGALYLSFGNASLSLALIPPPALAALEHEAFRVVGLRRSTGAVVVACNGRPLDPHTHTNVSFHKDDVHYGAVTAAYAVLEMLGFAFLHPLDSYAPSFLSLPCTHRNVSSSSSSSSSAAARACEVDIDVNEAPYWPERAFHIHTQHPLEITDVLQGHDIPQTGLHGPHCAYFSRRDRPHRRVWRTTGDGGGGGVDSDGPGAATPHDEASDAPQDDGMYTGHGPRRSNRAEADVSQVPYCERWEDMVDDVNRWYEWAVANRLNKVEWLLLGNFKWGDELHTRARRLRVLTALGHAYSLLVGADAPIGNIQQHAWYMVNTRLPYPQQAQQIRDRVDWIFGEAEVGVVCIAPPVALHSTHPAPFR